MSHDVSLSYQRNNRMPPLAMVLAILLHALVVLAFAWRPADREGEPAVDAIDVTIETAPPQTPEKQEEPAPPPAPPPSPPPTPPVAQQQPTPAPRPAPPMPLGLPPPNQSDKADGKPGTETPAARNDQPLTPDTTRQEEAKTPPAEAKPEQQQPPQQQAEPARPEPQRQEQPRQEPAQPPQQPPQQQALAPPPPPAPRLEQALPPLEAPPPPVTERDIPRPAPAPRAPAPPPPPPPRPQPQPAQRPPPPAPAPPPQQALRPSPLGQQPQRAPDRESASRQPPSATFQNPADSYGTRRAQEQYLWAVMRQISQIPYVPKNTTTIREEGTVLTRVTIARDGRLLNVVLERSSGLSSLDAGVMDTIRRASPYPPLPADIPGSSHTFQLPVSFRFNEQR